MIENSDIKQGIYAKYIKRILDFIFALIGLIFLSPLFLIVSLFVRMNLGSPVLFKQRRPGFHGKIFLLRKFRTMTDAKDENGELQPDSARLTKFGRFLRATSLDELPELVNILCGQMSFIGPRPLLEQYLPLYNEEQAHRHDVRPGLTGYAQVNGRNAISWEQKFNYDLEYVINITFWGDIKILLKTLAIVLLAKGVNSETSVTMDVFKGTER